MSRNISSHDIKLPPYPVLKGSVSEPLRRNEEAKQERCLQCNAELPPMSFGERGMSQMQCDLCAQQEIGSWLEEFEALGSGRMTEEEHLLSIAKQVLLTPKL